MFEQRQPNISAETTLSNCSSHVGSGFVSNIITILKCSDITFSKQYEFTSNVFNSICTCSKIITDFFSYDVSGVECATEQLYKKRAMSSR